MTRHRPVLEIGAGDGPALLTHFLHLDSNDRHLRFGTALGDESISGYVGAIDFDVDTVFGVYDNARDGLLGVVHVARVDVDVELGLSVLRPVRNQGIANRLFRSAVDHARSLHVRRILMCCLAQNGAVVSLARKNRMHVSRDLGYADAWLELRPRSDAGREPRALNNGLEQLAHGS